MLANDISSWECILWRKDGKCRATVKISPTDEFIEHVNDHTHAPSPTQVEVTKIKVGMKHKAKTTEATVQEILGEQLGNISADAAANCPRYQQWDETSGKHGKMVTFHRFVRVSRTSKRVPANQIRGAIFNVWQWRGESRKYVYFFIFLFILCCPFTFVWKSETL